MKQVRTNRVLQVVALVVSNALSWRHWYHFCMDPLWLFETIAAEFVLANKEFNLFIHEFASYLCHKPEDEVSRILNELRSRKEFYEELRVIEGSPALGHREVLYAVTRLLKPKLVVETGVFSGTSSAFILQAMKDNKAGILHSIDLAGIGKTLPDGNVYAIPREKSVGWEVPDRLRDRWILHLGDAQQLLPPLLNQLQEIDIFVHDSLHTRRQHIFEYNTAYPFIRRGGLLLTDDIDFFYVRFCKRLKCSPFHHNKMGGIVKS